MARGQRDFGQYAPKEGSASVSDMGEVAARLGSIVTYDKRGDVVDFDNFEEPVIKWINDGFGVVKYTILDSDNARSASQSVKMHSSNGVGGKASLYKGFALLAAKRLGTEISFSMLQALQFLEIDIFVFDGTTRHIAKVKLDPAAKKVYVWNASEAWEEVGNIGGLQIEAFLFHTLKLVVDFTNGVYARVMLNALEWDIPGVSYQQDASGEAPYVEVYIYLTNLTATSDQCWVDDFILTQAEP